MKNLLLILLLTAVITSCTTENDNSLHDRYSKLIGVWKPLTLSYDSSGVVLTREIPYDRLVIKSNLSYQVFLLSNSPSIENGTVKIITQNNDRLVLFFDAVYPSVSSKAGSHIFGFSHVEMDSLAAGVLRFKSVSNSYYPKMVFRFETYD